MGKGKGKRVTWGAVISPGQILYELKNVRLGRAIFFLKQLKYKIFIPSILVCKFFLQNSTNLKYKFTFLNLNYLI